MTADGFSRLEEELKHLKAVERPAVIRAIAEAREHGDLSENAEYHAARERQSFIEGRVAELEDKIARAEVIDVSKLSGKQVKFGATVTLVDEDTDEKHDLPDRRRDEADIATSGLSITSPLARALIGKTGRRHRRGHDARRLEVLRDRPGRLQVAAPPRALVFATSKHEAGRGAEIPAWHAMCDPAAAPPYLVWGRVSLYLLR